jgi:diguanylate cyclase
VNILIAEDEPSLRENLQWMLEMEGYTVQTASDGRDAYNKAVETPPDLILTDVMMPELDGYGLVKLLRENASTAVVPIIMLTAKADRTDVRTGMNLGADDYLTKPYRREELLEAVQARLARSASQHQAALLLQNETHQALQFDALTSLPKHDLFEQHLNTAVRQAVLNKNSVAVVCLGLDGFSKINESLGTAVGDMVLQEVADRLFFRMEVGPQSGTHDSVARLEGDLFAACLSGNFDAADVEVEAQAMMKLLAKPYMAQGHTLFLTACAGASIYPAQADTAQGLLLNAESALHHAKPCGPGSYRFFDTAMNQQVMRRLQIHNELHQAMEDGALEVYYQPQVRISTGSVVGFEALLRWNHPTLGWISPTEFITVAEDSGIIVKLGEWVMHTAASQAMQWIQQGHRDFRMAVNLSVRQFAGSKLPEMVQRVLQDTGLPPHVLELEITESLALQSVASTLSTLHACKSLGVKLAMDDFGTGYSSLAYLKRYPLDSLKVDQVFVRNVTQDSGNAAITRAIVALAHSFGMSVIAEGVETPEQLAFLRELGCEDFQGFLFSPPVPAHEAVQCFRGYSPRPKSSIKTIT